MSGTETLFALLTRLSEAGGDAILGGRLASRHAGPAFNRLLRLGVLVKRAPAEEWSVCARCECGLDARPIREIDGRPWAVCPLDHNSDQPLEPEDLHSFRIDPIRLVTVLAESSGFSSVEDVLPGAWDLGCLASGRRVVVTLTGDALEQPGFVLALRAIVGSVPLTIVAPHADPATRRRLLEADIYFVVLQSVLARGEHGVDVLGHAALEPSPTGPRLAILRRARRASLDGRDIRLSEQLFVLLLFLAERAHGGPETVEFRVIEDHVWGEGIHRISSGIREPIRALRKALAASAEDETATRKLIENTRNPNGYRLRLPAGDIVISD